MPPRRAVALGITGVTLAIVACAEDPPACYEGDYVGCACEPNTSGFTRGYAVCRPELGGYGTCICDGKTPGLDAGSASTDAASAVDVSVDAAKLALFAPCAKDEECASGKCSSYGDGRTLCTYACKVETEASDCPAPSRGCNGQGVCKPP